MKPKTETRIYKARTMFSGARIVGLDPRKFYVGIPDKGYKGKGIEVHLDGKRMLIPDWNKAESFRVHKNKFGPGTYTLGYFEWKPNE